MTKYKIALYIRLSLEDSKYDSLSIENQRMILNEYALSMPEAVNAELREFVDNGYSGTNFERPAIQELLELVRANKVDCIIVKDFSRFGRNSLETGYFMERVFPLFHTRFISVSDDYDSTRYKGDTGGMDVAFKYLIAEYYSRDMSIKEKSAKYAKMEQGEYQSKICPYGYRKSADGRMEPDPEAAETVQLIFQLAAAGNGGAEIARQLTARHIPTPGEYKAARGNHAHDISRTHGIWSGATVQRILMDERYIGSYVIKKREVVEIGSNRTRPQDRSGWVIIPDHHPSIVEKAMFEAAQAKTNRFKQPNKKRHEYPLKHKVFCGCCRHALSKTNYKRATYYCLHSFGIDGMDCNGARYPVVEIERSIFETLKKQVQLIYPDGIVCAEVQATGKQSDYEQQLTELQSEKMRLYECYVAGDLTAADYRKKKQDVDTMILKVKNICSALALQSKKEQEQHDELVQRQQIIRDVTSADKLTQELADILIERVYVYTDQRIEIQYKIQDLFVDAT